MGESIAEVAVAIDKLLSDEHDRYMNRAGYARGTDGHWLPVQAPQGHEWDSHAVCGANAILHVRALISNQLRSRP